MKNNSLFVERFGDYRLMRFETPQFDLLSKKEKFFTFCLYQAALSGRDILWDQNYKYNILIRRFLEKIYTDFQGDKSTLQWENFVVYLKKVWFSNGIHHHNSMDKFFPEIAVHEFKILLKDIDLKDFKIPSEENFARFTDFVFDLIYNPKRDSKRVNLDHKVDIVETSANNFYEGVSQTEAEQFYLAMSSDSTNEMPSFGMNSKLVKENDEIKELIWKIDGMYGPAIKEIVYWLEKSIEFACNSNQKKAIALLIEFYKTGDLTVFDAYSVAWVKENKASIDFINGFIEVYGDSLGRKATFESVVSMLDLDSTKRAAAISDNAQWFENNSPTAKEYKKTKVKGVSARGIHVLVSSGDCSPSMPIGINLPNADWIRAKHGSKSVTIGNVMDAYDELSKNTGVLEEFAFNKKECALAKKYGSIASKLHVDMHEIIGHGSGKLAPKVSDPAETLKNYASTIEEARADLVALYYAPDEKLIELGLMPSIEVGQAEYSSYIRGGLMTQLVRVELGKDIEESHQRNRQLIAKWCFENSKSEKVISKKIKNSKTYFVVNDYNKLRLLFGKLLAEIQRIKSEGDYDAAKNLVENYGVKVDYALHKEVLERWKSLDVPTFSGFLNPVFNLVEEHGKWKDIKVNESPSFSSQMLHYSANYSFL